MRYLLVILALIGFILIPGPVEAQTAIHFSSVNVDLWPEYDQPGLLVIYHLQLAEDTSLPTTLPLRIPAEAEINAVAVVDPTKGLINAPYQSSVQGDWATLSITITSSQVQVEYYLGLQKNGTARHIVYEWPGDNPVDKLDVNFLQPSAAGQIKIEPAPIVSAPGQGGLMNNLIRAANPPVGQLYKVTIDYQRQTDELSIASLPVQAVSTPGANTPGNSLTTPVPQWVIWGGAFAMLLAIVAYFFWRRSRTAVMNPTEPEWETRQGWNESIYCSECGKRAQPGDLFCRTCGARLKETESG